MVDTNVTEVGSATIRRVPSEAARVTLVVYDGEAQVPTTRVVELPDGGCVTVGRSRSADLVVDSERISRVHASFARTGVDVEVRDVGSRNGTWVNGEQIAGPRRLVSGDEVLIGSVTVVVNITTGTAVRPRLESTRYLEERLAAEVDRGLTYQRRFGFLLVALDGPAELVDAATDLLSSSLRPMEVIAEYAPAVLAIILPELDAAAASRTGRELIAKVAPADTDAAVGAGLGVAVGVVGFPEHSTTTGGILARANAALDAARRDRATCLAGPPDDPGPSVPDEVVIGDPKMARIYEIIRRVAEHSITVLVTGETGVGKEVIAAAIHAASSRRGGPLIRINCASLPETLLESELFGHERGAFTGADRRKSGFFEAAHRGTLFLDEIGEMTPALQAKLLRVLEQRKITRVGGTEEIEIDVRVICATHRDLEAEVQRNTFRSDLYFRIAAFTIVVPPLRDRPGEIELLAKTFLQQAAVQMRRSPPTLTPAALHALKRYPWPGNVRELRNALERALVLHSADSIGIEDLPDSIREDRPEPALATIRLDGQRDIREHIAELERDAIASALEAAMGNQTEAAKQLGISRRTLIYRMEKHGLKPLPAGRR